VAPDRRTQPIEKPFCGIEKIYVKKQDLPEDIEIFED